MLNYIFSNKVNLAVLLKRLLCVYKHFRRSLLLKEQGALALIVHFSLVIEATYELIWY